MTKIWHMCGRRGVMVVLFACFIAFFGCESKPKAIPVVKTIDTAAYWDSVYAPYGHKIDSFFTKQHKKRVFYGNVLFADSGRIVFNKAYGYKKRGTTEEITVDHSYQLASVSKTITATAVMMLVEQGKIGLFDTLYKYFPDLPYDAMTVHDLLCHRSGLPQYYYFCDNPDSIWPNKDSTIHNFEAIRIMNEIAPGLTHRIGRRFSYSNTNYVLLASIVEQVSGMPFAEYLEKFIFGPLKMESTRLYARDNKDELVKPVKGYEGNFSDAYDIYCNGVVGDKGVYSTTGDLLKFDQGLTSGKLMHDSTLQKMFLPHSKTKKKDRFYGYGFRTMQVEGYGQINYHKGWWFGFRSYFIRIPKTDQTIIIVSNVKRGPFLKVSDLVQYLP